MLTIIDWQPYSLFQSTSDHNTSAVSASGCGGFDSASAADVTTSSSAMHGSSTRVEINGSLVEEVDHNNVIATELDSQHQQQKQQHDEHLYHAYIDRRIAVATAASATPTVRKAIQKCRDKLSEDPSFVQAHHMLTTLLESIAPAPPPPRRRRDDTNVDDDDENDDDSQFATKLWQEVADPSWIAAGMDDITERSHHRPNDRGNRSLDDTARVQALLRTVRAETELQKVTSSRRIVEAYHQILPLLEHVEEVEAVLIKATPLLLMSSSSSSSPLSSSSSSSSSSMFSLLSQLAESLVEKFPQSVLVQQFRGAVFRKQGNLLDAYQSYQVAADLATRTYYYQGQQQHQQQHQQEQHQQEQQQQQPQSLESLETVVQSQILAASAAKEAGFSLEEQVDRLNLALSILDDAKHRKSRGNSDQDNDDGTPLSMLRSEVYNSLGVAYKAAGDTQAAIVAFRASLAIAPKDGHALVQLASLNALSETTTSTTTTTTTTASGEQIDSLDPDYVRGLFDGYSSRFEDELVHTLHYKGHKWVAEELVERMKKLPTTGTDPRSTANVTVVVDLGCGTGLVGSHLRSVLTDSTRISFWKNVGVRLLGVDLSPRMVETARWREIFDRDSQTTRKVYDRVDETDAVDYLGQFSSSIGAVVAADVFVYIGDLREVLKAAHKALMTNGILIFSVELLPSEGLDSGMKLLPSGRFGHSQLYLQQMAENVGFTVDAWKEGTLRKQRGGDVQGAVVVLQKQLGG